MALKTNVRTRKKEGRIPSNWNKITVADMCAVRSNVAVIWTTSVRLLNWAAFVLRDQCVKTCPGSYPMSTERHLLERQADQSSACMFVAYFMPTSSTNQSAKGADVSFAHFDAPFLCRQCVPGTWKLCILMCVCANGLGVCWHVHTQVLCGWREKDPFWQRVRWDIHFLSRHGA